MTTTTAPKPTAPKAAKAKAQNPTPAATPAQPDAPKVNQAYAPADVRVKITKALADLGELGFTRPQISSHTGLTLGAVWRAQNDKVHTSEVATYEAFVAKVVNKEIAPPERKASKVSAAALAERVANATTVLEAQAEAKNVTALRALVASALEALSA